MYEWDGELVLIQLSILLLLIPVDGFIDRND